MMMTLYRNRSVVLRLALAAMMIAGLAPGANAQGLLDAFFGAAPGRMESFCHRGTNIAVERFDPAGGCRQPALIILHGSDGPHKYAAKYRQAAAMAARRGYVVFMVQYFDATGTCPDDPTIMNMNAPRFKTWVSTVRAAVSYAAAQDNVDPLRIGLIGFSVGSYVALSAASADSRIGAVVDFFGGMPAAYARKASIMPPVIILHGQCDDMVSVREAHKLDRQLKKLGRPHELVIYPGQGHIFDKAASKDAAERTFVFLETYL